MKFIIAIGVVVVAIVYLVLTGVQATGVYSVTVGELKMQGNAAYNKAVRVAGQVDKNSIVRGPDDLLRFTLRDGDDTLPVVYRGIVPDLFGNIPDVLVEGKATPQGIFEAQTIIIRHGPEFEEAAPAAAGAK